MPPRNPDRNPGGRKVNAPNPRTQVQRGRRPDPERGVRRVGGGTEMNRRSFLGLLGGAVVVALGGLGYIGYIENDAREKYKAITNEMLRGAVLTAEIRGIKIYMGNSLFENNLLREELINSLEPIISILPDEMVRRIRFIRLDTSLDDSIPVPFEAASYAFVEGMRLVIYSKNIKNGISPEIKIRLREVVIHEAVHLMTYGNPYKLRWLRQNELSQCETSFKRCIESLTDLIDIQSLEEWLQISRQHGDYASDTPIPVSQIREEDLIKQIAFGYILDNPDLDYGRLNIAEDIACVFEKILSLLYEVIIQGEDREKVIIALLKKTPGETGLYKKYLIACKSLIKWYEEGSRQHEILREFIRIIKDAIKAGGTTGGQRTSVESLRGRLAAIREAGRIPNSQGTQTIKDAIKAGGTTGVQKTPLGWLMGQRFTNTGKSAGQGPS